MNPDQYIDINKKHWNQKVEPHVNSSFYRTQEILDGENSLNEIELKLLGNIEGKRILHLQCHFGLDTISLARMGAEVTGVDFSEQAIEKATQLARSIGLDNVRFIQSDIYALPDVLLESFDVVFTSYGTIGWLPDLLGWAKVINQFLKPGGQFVFAEFHPVVWMFDDDFEEVKYSYFNRGPIVETEQNTYADRKISLPSEYVGWNHGMSEVVQSLLQQSLTLQSLEEFDYSPYNCFRNTVEKGKGKYYIQGMEHKLPMVYVLSFTKSL